MNITALRPFLRAEDEISLRWRAVRRIWAAVAIAAFPLVFMLDTVIEGFSPVLPGAMVLVLLWVAMPYVHFEAWRPKAPQIDRTRQHEIRSRYLLGVAVVWFVLWLVFS